MKARTSSRNTSAVAIFIGVLLIVIFVVGLIASKDPTAFQRKNRYDITLDQFIVFCSNWWMPAGIIGIPIFVISMIRSFIQESKEQKK